MRNGGINMNSCHNLIREVVLNTTVIALILTLTRLTFASNLPQDIIFVSKTNKEIGRRHRQPSQTN
jgi:hypothetical protein